MHGFGRMKNLSKVFKDVLPVSVETFLPEYKCQGECIKTVLPDTIGLSLLLLLLYVTLLHIMSTRIGIKYSCIMYTN